MPMFMIHCRTEGGVTGTRTGWMKDKGVIQTYHTEEAARRNKPESRTLPYPSGATLTYTIHEFATWPRCECGCIAQDHNKLRSDGNHACDICSCQQYQPNSRWAQAVL